MIDECQTPDRPVLLRELRVAGVYCVLKAYLDESYDDATMCVGGWLCNENTWTQIETQWLRCIEREGRISLEHGHKPVPRYHATDCANLKKDFAQSNGLNIPRQIKLTKNLVDILGSVKAKPTGIAAGLRLRDLRKARPKLGKSGIRDFAYYLCMSECLHSIGEAMDVKFPSERVMVIHESSASLNKRALGAYDYMKIADFPYAKYFKAFSPGSWQDYPALQAADLLAFEGFKLTAQSKRGEPDLRKSLQRVMGHAIDVYAIFLNAKGPAGYLQ